MGKSLFLRTLTDWQAMDARGGVFPPSTGKGGRRDNSKWCGICWGKGKGWKSGKLEGGWEDREIER